MTGRRVLGAMAYTWLHVLWRDKSRDPQREDLDGR